MFNLLLDIPVSWVPFVFPVQLLQFRNHLVRVKCFELLGAISLGSEPRVRTLLTTFSDDPDPRVRMAVLGAMVSRKILHQMLIDLFYSSNFAAAVARARHHALARLVRVELQCSR